MTDQDRFERQLEERLRAHVAAVDVSFDAVALARAAASAPRRARWSERRPHIGPTMRPLLLIIGLLLALLGVAGLVGSTRLLDRGPLGGQAPGSFAETGSLSQARYWHTSVLLPDGRVLVTGGFPTIPPDSEGMDAPAHVLPAEIYDPASGTFSSLPALSPANQGSSATVLQDGRVLIAGGRTREQAPLPDCMSSCRMGGTAIDTAVIFDPRTGTSAPVGPLNEGRFMHAAALLRDGRVLIAGGRTGAVIDLGDGSSTMEVLDSAELYDPATNTFSRTGSLSEPVAPDIRYAPHVMANLLPDGTVLVGNEVFDPTTGSFGPVDGDDGSAGEGVVLYLDEYGTLRRLDPVLAERSGEHPAVLEQPPVSARGIDHRMVASLLADGRVLWQLGGGGTSRVWIGDPDANVNGPTGPMVTDRAGHTTTLLGDGRVLVIGGYHRTGETDRKQGPLRVSLASAELYLPGSTAALDSVASDDLAEPTARQFP
jgi:hypothetical protein